VARAFLPAHYLISRHQPLCR